MPESNLSKRLRETAKNIENLLKEYETYRWGDEMFRKGEVDPKTKKPLGSPPQIHVTASPDYIYLTEEEINNLKNNPGIENEIINPLLKGLVDKGELKPEEALYYQSKLKVRIIRDLGIGEIYECRILLPWISKLAKEVTYLLQILLTYSEEIKAKYQELLIDLEILKGKCNELARKLARQGGTLTSKQYREFMGEIIHFTRIAQAAALQLADYHDEFIARGAPPLAQATTEATKWFLEEKEEEK